MTARVPHRIGVYLALVQFFFTLTWTVYVIYLPKLAAQAGLSKQAVVYILLLDQIIFVVMDYAMGLAADRVSRVLGKLGYAILGITLASCLAFLLLPFVAPQGAAWLFLLLTVLWTVSSSALRAPPLVLIGKYAAQPAVPWLSALSLLGLGIASAISPLGFVLRDADPRVPFALSSAALALATLGIVWAERALARDSSPAAAATPIPAARAGATPWMLWFLFSVLLLGLGYQIHFSLNSAALYLRYAPAADLPYLMPVFWIGFNVLMLPASFAAKRYGGLRVAAVGALVSALASFAAYHAGDLTTVIAAQFVAGGGWGWVLMSAVSAAIAIGHTGREGKMTGGLFSLLAFATFARIAILAAQLNQDPLVAGVLAWAPAAAWGISGVLLLMLLPHQRKPVAATV